MKKMITKRHILFAAVALLSSSCYRIDHSNSEKGQQQLPGLLERIELTGIIHAGYGVYPPYTQEDPTTGEVSGFCVDIIEQIAKELKVKVEWHRINWNTMAADLRRGEFDIIADAVYQTIPRAREFAFTDPYTYFADGIAVVRKEEERISTFGDLNKKNIRVSVGLGWASETLLRARLDRSDFMLAQTTTDLQLVFSDLVSGRADVTIVDASTAKRFVEEQSGFRALWLENPPAYMPAGFALRFGDRDAIDFMNVSLHNLRSTGILHTLAIKHDIPSSDVPFPEK